MNDSVARSKHLLGQTLYGQFIATANNNHYNIVEKKMNRYRVLGVVP
jgi:hypothetical protein